MNLEFRGNFGGDELNEVTQAMKLFENNYFLEPKDALIHVIKFPPKEKRVLYMISPEGLDGLYHLPVSSPNNKLISVNFMQKTLKIEIEDWKIYNSLSSKN